MKPEAISVTQLNQYIKEKIGNDDYLNNVLVKGEISNFKNHYTGHMYFTLKDGTSLIKCVMFKTYTTHLPFMPKDGMKVLLFGSVAVYERDGIYQIYAKAMQQDGIGSLYEAYEKLKAQLETEGLFAPEHKKAIPVFPKCIGVLTSNTGAVIRDIIHVATRRNPGVYIQLYPVPVQGAGAAEKIVEAIQYMNQQTQADVLIVARGGGSIEDLWPFNEEIVARAIFASHIPVISAVGHETDYTIADFVADLRAPTPSAAAELAVPDVAEWKQKMENYKARYTIALRKQVEWMQMRYEKCMARGPFAKPYRVVHEKGMVLDHAVKHIVQGIESSVQNKQHQAMQIITKLDALSPLKTLTRGYALAKQNGKVIKSVEQIQETQPLQIQWIDGQIEAEVKEIRRNTNEGERK